eukprot:CAMPEP_0175366696 /NCGR_PEP_ID=MMETSP0095-20121207/19270_1 /TAXON_ID=311494 /ORGANISM="Alexandrium monilatum, Strain CCMP3105" /LENGTH=228 /DNA_ID=CAMNT_0016664711 /DNA_START=246 /DNA_END=935 /DNA_ORIENTATION=-
MNEIKSSKQAAVLAFAAVLDGSALSTGAAAAAELASKLLVASAAAAPAQPVGATAASAWAPSAAAAGRPRSCAAGEGPRAGRQTWCSRTWTVRTWESAGRWARAQATQQPRTSEAPGGAASAVVPVLGQPPGPVLDVGAGLAPTGLVLVVVTQLKRRRRWAGPERATPVGSATAGGTTAVACAGAAGPSVAVQASHRAAALGPHCCGCPAATLAWGSLHGWMAAPPLG